MNQTSSLKSFMHYPVMLKEVIKVCSPEKGGLIVDCTYGSGGYTNALLAYPNTKVIALDRDSKVEKFVAKTNKKYKSRFSFHNLKFSEISKAIPKNLKADTVIFDLGLSSIQINDFERGFSFNSNGRLDMQMGLNLINGVDVINKFNLKTIKDILLIFGEESEGKRIAFNIVKEREKNIIKSVPDLVRVIKKSKKRDFNKKINISTKTFQAIRIFVNKEISELINGLINATSVLKTGGKLVVVTFHSLEDKIVKYFFKNFSRNRSKNSRYYPDKEQDEILFRNYNNTFIKPSILEISKNNPSRSAKLRYAIRSDDKFFYPKDFENNFSKYIELEKRNV